ncbi:MAG TPA: hypothetical protein VII84_10235, partial [Acidimicrobiales bacterium]
MRVAVWTPLPPDPSGIADYNMTLLAAMARDRSVRITAIVRDDVSEVQAPVGVSVRSLHEYRAEDYDIDLYHVGNNPTFHSYEFRAILSRPGVVVLHDPAIADFIEVMLGNRQRRIFEVELAYNLGCSDLDADRLQSAIERWDRTEMLMSRRVVEA